MSKEFQDLNTNEYELSCPSCLQDILHNIDGHIICTDCGTVVSSYVISERKELERSGGVLDSRTNVSNDKNISSYLQKGSNSYICKNGVYVKCDIYRLHVQNSYSSSQKSIDNVENIIDTYTFNKYPEAVKKISKRIWDSINKVDRTIRSSIRKGVIMCCIYYACIDCGCPRSIHEISNDFCENSKVFNKGDKVFKEIISNISEWKYLITSTIGGEDYFKRFCNILKQNNIIYDTKKNSNDLFMVINKCIEIYKTKKDLLNIVGPKSLAAGIIFYICKKEGFPVTKSNISKHLDICYPTLTKTIELLQIN